MQKNIQLTDDSHRRSVHERTKDAAIMVKGVRVVVYLRAWRARMERDKSSYRICLCLDSILSRNSIWSSIEVRKAIWLKLSTQGHKRLVLENYASSNGSPLKEWGWIWKLLNLNARQQIPCMSCQTWPSTSESDQVLRRLEVRYEKRLYFHTRNDDSVIRLGRNYDVRMRRAIITEKMEHAD